MPQGLQIFDAAGNVVLDYTTHVGRFVGEFTTTGAVSGSFTDSRLVGMELLIYLVTEEGITGGPEVSSNPATGLVSWEYHVSTAGDATINPADRIHTFLYGGY